MATKCPFDEDDKERQAPEQANRVVWNENGATNPTRQECGDVKNPCASSAQIEGTEKMAGPTNKWSSCALCVRCK